MASASGSGSNPSANPPKTGAGPNQQWICAACGWAFSSDHVFNHHKKTCSGKPHKK
ncbi:hypothetical protein DAEQUDRAFT_770086 [Daedalea quercina L-15889]|uniref:C2H2-type domain-containing protein n=1 Tax=Daedalea quercina L-15889 TaxID=1314783 RepID=A0A165L6F6_9APHY|nr:hypothetical protein DAEQUDRAFT_770086 [Daedalea quercina L-15889]